MFSDPARHRLLRQPQFIRLLEVSYVFWRFIQNSADVLKNVAKRTAVSPVIPRCSLTIAVIRFAGTSSALANMLAFKGGSEGFMNSSRRISPGCTGRMPFFTMASSPSVIIYDFDLMRPVIFP